MSKFGALPSDNVKTDASDGSIFYRPMATLSHQYRTQRQSQANSNQSKTKRSTTRRTTLLKPVGRIALGGRSKPKTIATNKSDTSKQQQLLRNYKQNYSRAAFDTFKKDELPPGTITCTLFKKSLACNRGYVGHFTGSKGPRFPKSKIRSIREDDLQTKLERLENDKTLRLNAKRREEEIARLKFGLQQDPAMRNKYDGERPFWFQFEEAPKAQASSQENEEEDRRHWLGKPKKDDKNYCYVMMEWATGTRATHSAFVYPVTFMEFGQRDQLVAEGQASAESAEKRHRQQLEKWRKKQAEKSMMEKLGNLFGHDDEAKSGKKKRPKADEISEDSKQRLKDMYMDKEVITEEEGQMLKDMLGEETYTAFVDERGSYLQDKKNKPGLFGALQTGDNEENSTFDGKVLSNRLRKTKTRGQLEELNDFNEIISDDEDDTNLNDYDVIDDGEEDLLESDGFGSSEEGASFKKLKANMEDPEFTKKEYALPIEDKKKEELTDDEEDEGDLWNVSDSEEESDDDDGAVKVKRKEGDKEKEAEKKGGKKRALTGGGGGRKSKKRKLNEEDLDKLKEEMQLLVTKIFKQNPNGLQMQELWQKITATLSADADSIKKALAFVLKAIAKKVTVGSKKCYTLKDKLK